MTPSKSRSSTFGCCPLPCPTMPPCLQEYPRALGALLAEVKQTGGSPEAHQRMQRLIAEGGRLRGSIAGKFSSLRTHACPDMSIGYCTAHLDGHNVSVGCCCSTVYYPSRVHGLKRNDQSSMASSADGVLSAVAGCSHVHT